MSGSAALSEALRRARAVQRLGAPVPGLGVPAGREAPPACADAPVVLLLALGLGHDELETWADLVARAQARGHRFRPLWVLDSGDLPVVLTRGWACDHVVTAQQHAGLGAPQGYAEHLALRLDVWRSRTGAPVVPLLAPPTRTPADGEPADGEHADLEADRLGAVLTAATGQPRQPGVRLSARARAAAAGRRRTRS